ncbi:MBL fold metallo-hydrolase [Nonomuraea soli]|uniref:Glyoxylase-like metal-dependent hydrolase (Beta-lactamase superfamily II) n=1 Tax=Nonomuraea soli TaxID=1032476 RepID=A0A7W0CHQ3_9ACTN|nr:MBL fold metallo-hydrolase [Nonomuraea soli]MBA2891388.1 glyoxylase-like metal-dependent hydrolase (beta-lactamase superfamily II) [Nonomuraea soli]
MSGLYIPIDTPDGSRTEHAENLLAPNPGMMTLDGTNTWVIGGEQCIVVDPGPDDEAHLLRVRDHLGDRNVTQILLTHGHVDHSGGARRFAELVKAPVRALDPAHRLGEEGLRDGDVVTVAGVELHVYGTPGHSFDSLCFWLAQDRAMLTGDTVLGRGTTVIAQDGGLGDYLRSLDRLRAAAEELEAMALLPGHGPVLPDPLKALDGYIAHRRERLDQIRKAQAAGARTASEVVAIVYADVDRALWPVAEVSVRAQLDYLERL